MWGTEQIWLIALGAFLALVGNILYMLGGTSGFKKWVRRFLGSFVIALASSLVAIFSTGWEWKYLLIFPCLTIGFSLPYGSDVMIWKVIKRTIFALGVISACLVGCWIASFNVSSIVVLGLAIVTGLTSVVLGVFNPFLNAPLEQFLICQLLCLYVPWFAFLVRV